MKVLIPTCDRYVQYIEALQLSVREHGLGEYDFIILGYERPKFQLDHNFWFHSLGKDRGPGKWSDDISSFIKASGIRHFIYGSDDCALTFVNKELLRKAVGITVFQNNIGRFALTKEGMDRDTIPFFVKNREGAQVRQFDHNSNYRLSLGWSVWNAECFLEFCAPGMSPWDFELSSCGTAQPSELVNWAFTTFNPEDVIDAAYFRRKNIPTVIPTWNEGYYGHNLEGELLDDVRKVLEGNSSPSI